jgi:arylsulfatase A-like enzyme
LRDKYGRNLFGQGCLLARRLVERGVPFVEVSLGGVNGGAFGWDTHGDNFNQVKALSRVLDAGWGTLMSDLKSRGLLDSTLIVWMGEFGRTPQINGQRGRDHFPNAWSTVLAGGGLKGGQVVGKTSKDGTTVEEKKVEVPDLLATVCGILGIDPTTKNRSNVGRPIPIVKKTGVAIKEVLS